MQNYAYLAYLNLKLKNVEKAKTCAEKAIEILNYYGEIANKGEIVIIIVIYLYKTGNDTNY